MTQEEIEEIKDRMESCPWCEHPPGDGAVPSRLIKTEQVGVIGVINELR